MKKYFFIITAVLFLSAACAKQQAQVQPAQNQPAQEQEKTSLVDFDGRLRIDSPKEGESVGASFVISGYAQGWFEGNIPIKVYDNANNLLFNGSTIVSNNYDSPQAFSFTVILQKALTAGTGKIVLSDYSEKDGSLVYEKKVNIKFINEVSNWKTYRNDKFGFEVKYPNTWQYKEDKGSLISFCASDAKSCGLVSEGIAGNIFISIEGNPKNLTAQQFLESKGMKITVGGVGESSKKKVDNHNAILLGPEGLAAAGSIFIENGNYIIELQGQSSGSEFDSMINSFKFTK